MENWKKFKWFIIGTVGVLIMAMGTLVVVDLAEKSNTILPEIAEIPDFEFIEHHEGATFAKANMLGKINLVDFIFTQCKGPCPMMTSKMAILYDQYKTNPEIQFVSMSVDPMHDSLPVLQEYAKNFNVSDKRWSFLQTPSLDIIQDVAENGFKVSGKLPYNHNVKFVLVDAKGIIRGYYNPYKDENMQQLTIDVKLLLDEMK